MNLYGSESRSLIFSWTWNNLCYEQCRKKHSYVCPVFEATGECPQESRCKLHHPKKKNKSKRSKVDTVQNNSWGRYFETSIGHGSGARIVSLEEEERQKPEQVSGEDFADFIELGSDIEVPEDADASDDIQPMELDSGNLDMQADNLEAIIKPLRIMRTARVWRVLLLDIAAVLLGQGGMLCYAWRGIGADWSF